MRPTYVSGRLGSFVSVTDVPPTVAVTDEGLPGTTAMTSAPPRTTAFSAGAAIESAALAAKVSGAYRHAPATATRAATRRARALRTVARARSSFSLPIGILKQDDEDLGLVEFFVKMGKRWRPSRGGRHIPAPRHPRA